MSRLDWRGDEAKREMRKAAAGAATDAAEYLLHEANKTVPIEEGTLGRSGTVTPATEANPTATLSYDTPYALVQHEDMTFRHDPGRRAKWLELTLREQASKVGQFLADRVRGRFA